MSLSILCVTSMPDYAPGFIAGHLALAQRLGAQSVVATDGRDAHAAFRAAGLVTAPDVWVRFRFPGGGYIEPHMERAVIYTNLDAYILRLDDDEAVPPALEAWLAARTYETAPAWRLPQAHLWGDASHVITDGALWPSYQRRLAVRSVSYRAKTAITDVAAPVVGTDDAPEPILHHKFLVQSVETRRARKDNPRRPARAAELDVPEDAIARPKVERLRDVRVRRGV